MTPAPLAAFGMTVMFFLGLLMGNVLWSANPWLG